MNSCCRRTARLNATSRSGLTLVELLVVLFIIFIVACLLIPATRGGGRGVREAARRNQCLSNLKQIAIALQNYADAHGGTLPPAYTTDENGKPLHSWRTLILPYLEEQALYDSIDLTKPWDDPANAEACKKSLSAYQCPSALFDDTRTTYLAVVTPNSCMRATEPRPLPDAKHASKAMTVIEVDQEHAVPWMSPVDADEQIVLALGGPNSKLDHQGVMLAAFADCHTESLSGDLPADQRLALISIDGGDKAAEGTE